MEFDGIWTCASLLHVPRAEIDHVLARLTRASTPFGVIYMSFKYGTCEEFRDGRSFSDYDEASANSLLQSHFNLDCLKMWISSNLLPDRAKQRWLNMLAQK